MRERGIALLEFALVLPILIMLLVGIIEYGRYTYFVIEIGNAAHAGVQYGSLSLTNGADFTGMKEAAIADGQNSIFPLTISAVAAQNVCTCWTAGTGESPSPPTATFCGQNCTSGGLQVTYAKVSVTAKITPLFNYAYLGLPPYWTVTRTAMIRVTQKT